MNATLFNPNLFADPGESRGLKKPKKISWKISSIFLCILKLKTENRLTNKGLQVYYFLLI